MCSEQELVLNNTRFRKKQINNYTWERLNGSEKIDRGMIDCMFLKRKIIKRMEDVHVYKREAGVMLNHFLVEEKRKVERECKS